MSYRPETAIRLAKEEQEEITHVKTRVGDKVGADRSFPAGRYVVHKMLGKGMNELALVRVSDRKVIHSDLCISKKH